jgi:hypothetical protein
VWDRGNRFALLSATILNKAAFCRGVGLDPANVALVDVEHTFPVANRPLYDVTRGKMTYDDRAGTLPKVARALVRIAAAHPSEKGLVHCHSYAIQSELRTRLARFGLGSRLRVHDREDRDAALEAWTATDDPDVFLSVKMEEALDLAGDLCRWQVVCKAPYLNTTDSRVARRLEEGQWALPRGFVAARTVRPHPRGDAGVVPRPGRPAVGAGPPRLRDGRRVGGGEESAVDPSVRRVGTGGPREPTRRGRRGRRRRGGWWDRRPDPGVKVELGVGVGSSPLRRVGRRLSAPVDPRWPRPHTDYWNELPVIVGDGADDDR